MSVHEQEQVKAEYHSKSMRYMENAKACLLIAKKKGKYNNDKRYVRMPCITAYSGLLEVFKDNFPYFANHQIHIGLATFFLQPTWNGNAMKKVNILYIKNIKQKIN